MCGVFEAEPMKKMFSQRLARSSRHGLQWPHQRDGLTGDTVADLHARRGACDLDDLAGDLVAEHQRRGHDEIAGAGVAVVMHVGAANAAGAETDTHHARDKRIERPLDHAQIFRAEQGCGQSHRRHFESPMYFGSQSVSSGM